MKKEYKVEVIKESALSSLFLGASKMPVKKMEAVMNQYGQEGWDVSFQVIEHIKNDKLFIKEIYRILKPGGKALISTPNISMSLTRNPWHVREYTSQQLFDLASRNFKKIIMKGICGNDKIKKYYDDNKKSVMKFKRLDIFNLEKYLPNFLYKIPYEFLNRMNRNKLQANDNSLVSSITTNDYSLENDNPKNLDLFLILEK